MEKEPINYLIQSDNEIASIFAFHAQTEKLIRHGEILKSFFLVIKNES